MVAVNRHTPNRLKRGVGQENGGRAGQGSGLGQALGLQDPWTQHLSNLQTLTAATTTYGQLSMRYLETMRAEQPVSSVASDLSPSLGGGRRVDVPHAPSVNSGCMPNVSEDILTRMPAGTSCGYGAE